jgi:hypothetical protein
MCPLVTSGGSEVVSPLPSMVNYSQGVAAPLYFEAAMPIVVNG